jgi:hypothetical protein
MPRCPLGAICRRLIAYSISCEAIGLVPDLCAFSTRANLLGIIGMVAIARIA